MYKEFHAAGLILISLSWSWGVFHDWWLVLMGPVPRSWLSTLNENRLKDPSRTSWLQERSWVRDPADNRSPLWVISIWIWIWLCLLLVLLDLLLRLVLLDGLLLLVLLDGLLLLKLLDGLLLLVLLVDTMLVNYRRCRHRLWKSWRLGGIYLGIKQGADLRPYLLVLIHRGCTETVCHILSEATVFS